MQYIRHLLFLTAFVSTIFASIPPQTNTPYAQVITESKTDGTHIHYTYGNDLIGDGTHYFLTDALGSTRGLVDDVQTLTDSYDYKPYGELASHTGSSTNSFLFTGEQLDQETNNYYLRARYYSPSLTRFLSRDTYDGKASDPLSQNHYLYAGGNPVLYVDLSGHMSMPGLMNTLSIMSTLSNVYTVASIAIELGTGNYVGAGKNIAVEIVSAKLGRIRMVGAMTERGVALFANIFRRGKPPKLNLSSGHSSTILAENMKALGFHGSASAAHHIVGSGRYSRPANEILRNAGININSPSNGVFLPDTKIWRTSPASPHIGGHNKAYFDMVNEKLSRAVVGKTPGTDAYKWAVINAISEIRLKLLTGQVTLNKNMPFN